MKKQNLQKERDKIIKDLQKEFNKVSVKEQRKFKLINLGLSLFTILKGIVALSLCVLIAKYLVWLYNLL